MSLKDKISSFKPREIAGSRTSKRYDYQKDWSLCRVLQLHSESEDYLALFDYFDDFVILNSEKEPKQAEFYQIKTKSKGNYTLTNLLSSKKDKEGNSLLCVASKLYENKTTFDPETKSLCLVTNVNFNLELKDEKLDSQTKSHLEFDELSDKVQKKIHEKIKLELKKGTIPNCSKLMFFKVSSLSLEDSSGHTKGKLTEFLESLTPGKKYRIPAIYQSLFDEIKNKSGNTKTSKSFEELKKNKGISKTGFDKILHQIGVNSKAPDLWDKIDSELKLENVSYDKRKALKVKYNYFEVERMNRKNTRLFQIVEKVQEICLKMEAKNKFSNLTLLESANLVHDTFDIVDYTPYDSKLLKAIILDEIYY